MHDYWSSIVNPGYPMQDINSGTKSSPVPKERKPGFKSLEVRVLIIWPLPFLLLPFSDQKAVKKDKASQISRKPNQKNTHNKIDRPQKKFWGLSNFLIYCRAVCYDPIRFRYGFLEL